MEAGTNTDLLNSKPNALTTKLSYFHCLNLSESGSTKLSRGGGGREGKKTEHLSGIFLTHLEADTAYIDVSLPYCSPRNLERV